MPYKKGRSVADVNNKIDNFVNKEIPQKIEAGLYSVATSLGGYADFYVPVDTNALMNSREHRVAKVGGNFVATVGYYQKYAAALHSPKPGGKMDGWKPRTPEMRAELKSAKNYTGRAIGGFNINAKQGWLNIAWEWKGEELLEKFRKGLIE
jgi:hypothetical protein